MRPRCPAGARSLPEPARLFVALLRVALLLPALQAGAAPAPACFDHGPWDRLLAQYVNDDGQVAYRDLQAKAAASLNAYMASIAAARPDDWPRDE